MSATDVLGLVASAVFIARLTPQPVHLARSGVAAGVSPLASLNAVTAAAAWLVYGLIADLPVVWIVSVLALIPGVWAVALLRRRTTARDLGLAGVWVAVVVVGGLVGWLSVMLSVGVVVTQGPQVLRACREDDLRGLTASTWWLSILDAATWGAYGAAVGDGALLGYAAVLSTSAVIVLARIWWTSRRAAPLATVAAASPAPTLGAGRGVRWRANPRGD